MTIVLASGNAGKLREIRAALTAAQAADLHLPCAAELGASAADELHGTFFENALAKARVVAAYTGLAALSDDSGLVVSALCGKPGVHSARYAGANANDDTNNKKLLDAMCDVADRRAFYYAAMVYVAAADDPVPVFAEGFWRGEIITEPRGNGGFGYDPLFFDPTVGKTGAQMTAEEKNRVSHRGLALRRLLRLLKRRKIL